MSEADIITAGLKEHIARQKQDQLLARFQHDPFEPVRAFRTQGLETNINIYALEAALRVASRLLAPEKQVEAIFGGEDPESDLLKDFKRAAKEQFDLGYPGVYGQTLLTGWSLLENCLGSTIQAVLSGPSDFWRHCSLLRDKVNIRDYESWRTNGSIGTELFKRMLNSVRSETTFAGWSKLLKSVSLMPRDGQVCEKVRELTLIRNLLAHSPNGTVTQQFLDSSPTAWRARWPEIEVGKVLLVKNGDAQDYILRALDFAEEVKTRLGLRVTRFAEKETLKPSSPPPVGLLGLALAMKREEPDSESEGS